MPPAGWASCRMLIRLRRCQPAIASWCRLISRHCASDAYATLTAMLLSCHRPAGLYVSYAACCSREAVISPATPRANIFASWLLLAADASRSCRPPHWLPPMANIGQYAARLSRLAIAAGMVITLRLLARPQLFAITASWWLHAASCHWPRRMPPLMAATGWAFGHYYASHAATLMPLILMATIWADTQLRHNG